MYIDIHIHTRMCATVCESMCVRIHAYIYFSEHTHRFYCSLFKNARGQREGDTIGRGERARGCEACLFFFCSLKFSQKKGRLCLPHNGFSQRFFMMMNTVFARNMLQADSLANAEDVAK